MPAIGTLPLEKRPSVDGRDDISPNNLEYLRGKSKKIDDGKYVISNFKLAKTPEVMASYKDFNYRSKIADRYGIFLMYNQKGFAVPHLKKTMKNSAEKKSLYTQYKEKYG